MKIKQVLVIVFVLIANSIFSESRKVIDQKNEYNGITEELIFEENENEQLIKVLIFTNDKNVVIKNEYYTTPFVSDSSGIEKQIVYYDIIQNPTKYEMEFTNEYFNIHGVDKLIEHVKDDIVTLSEWFKDDVRVDYLDDIDVSNRYPFYKLSFLTTQIIDKSINTDGKDYVNFSAKYRGLRTVVLCNGDIEPLNETDLKILDYTSKNINWPQILSYYSSKMLIEEDGKKYTMYIQNGLEELIPTDRETTIRYYTIGYNGELYLTMVNVLR